MNYQTSETPETDKHTGLRFVACELIATARRIERERDKAKFDAADESRWAIGYKTERDQLRDAIRNMRDVKGRHHTHQATERLFALLPESSSQPEA